MDITAAPLSGVFADADAVANRTLTHVDGPRLGVPAGKNPEPTRSR
jgi:hypothetical protein